VGPLSDTSESLVNIVAALGALVALTIAEREPDEEHAFGYERVECFATGLEGGPILLAVVSIVVAALPRLVHPATVSEVGWGIAVSTLASLINFGVA
jgi:divalent metal cation (Fe/Co/Zn/Cd) transporter